MSNEEFIGACRDGDLEKVKNLLLINPEFDISANNEEAFRWACHNGCLEVVKFLLFFKPDIDISAENDYAFRQACFYGRLDVVKFLTSLNKKYNYSINEKGKLCFRIDKEIKYLETIERENKDCLICFGKSDLKTSCGHYGCESCFQRLKTDECPYCRQEITHYYKIEN